MDFSRGARRVLVSARAHQQISTVVSGLSAVRESGNSEVWAEAGVTHHSHLDWSKSV